MSRHLLLKCKIECKIIQIRIIEKINKKAHKNDHAHFNYRCLGVLLGCRIHGLLNPVVAF